MSVTKDYRHKYSWEHTTMRTTKKHRRIYEDYYNVRLPSDIEIHHIDGNHNNNDITNLMPVTIQEHFEIHQKQGDYAAAFRISQRMEVSTEEKSRLASLAASKANAEGKCGFKLGHASQAGKIGGKKGGVYAKENRTGIFALTPEQNKQRHFNSVVTKMIKNGKASAWPREERL
jgi:hypothetical protein